jgi:hypothetical protein
LNRYLDAQMLPAVWGCDTQGTAPCL